LRFHVLGIPHTITTPAYSSCAFTQKVLKLCRMLVGEGHEVFHYGHAASQVPCRTIASTFPEDLEKSYPGWDWKQDGFPKFSKDDHVYRKFYERAIRQIERRKQPNDFLLCTFGDWHKPVADAHSDMIVVESGIGYPNGSFARYRVFESYAIMHAYQGNTAAASATENAWYDAVIPNQIDLRDFKYEPVRGGYLLFLGRLNAGKGIHIAKQLADSTMTPLIIAGPGDPGDLSPLHTCVGNVHGHRATQISDVIVPAVFTPYTQQLTMEKTAIIQSGIAARDDFLDNCSRAAVLPSPCRHGRTSAIRRRTCPTTCRPTSRPRTSPRPRPKSPCACRATQAGAPCV
jgi:glycosyltransferase involved in cell wall biosynthesis